jgi:enamine deaminase RidA (YjgF/YER057c/UK114 family)
MSYEARVKELKLELPPSVQPVAVYRLITEVGNLGFVSGHGPVSADGTAICGRLGETLDKETGYEAARRTGLRMLSSLRTYLGSLDRVVRLVKTNGFVNCTPDFIDHPAVVNGFSELMRDVFGPESGVGARSSLGITSLPAGWAVEIEAIFEFEPAESGSRR